MPQPILNGQRQEGGQVLAQAQDNQGAQHKQRLRELVLII